MKNKYTYHSKISEGKSLFDIDLDALHVAEVMALTVIPLIRYTAAFRERTAQHCEAEQPVSEAVEVAKLPWRGIRGGVFVIKLPCSAGLSGTDASTLKLCPTGQSHSSRHHPRQC